MTIVVLKPEKYDPPTKVGVTLGSVFLNPGANTISEDALKELQAHPMYQDFLDSELITIKSGSAPAPVQDPAKAPTEQDAIDPKPSPVTTQAKK
jgi:hypothetical protein